MDVTILSNIGHLLTLSTFPPVAHHALTTRPRGIGENRQVHMPPWLLHLHRQFMDVVVVAHKHDLLGTARCPTVPCGHLNGWRGSRHGGEVCTLPASSRMDAQFLNMTILSKIGHLLGSTLWPCIANEKEAAGSGCTCQRGQVGVL